MEQRMNPYGSQKALNTINRSLGGSKPDLAGNYAYGRIEMPGGNGYTEGYNTYTISKTSMGGGQSQSQLNAVHQKATILQGQSQEYLRRAEQVLQSGGDSARASAEAEKYMNMSRDCMEQLKGCALDLRQLGAPNDTVIRSIEQSRDQMKGINMAFSGTMTRKNRGSVGYEDPGRSFNDAIGWIGQQKRLIETSSWGDDSATIGQQIINHNKFQSSISRSPEVDRARDELMQKGDKANLNSLEQEWDSLQKLSYARSSQLHDLNQIIEDISREIMWVNEHEEEELVFDWGDRNIDVYIPKKQESYSRLMRDLEEKEKDLNKLKLKVDGLLKNNHPASDKIEAYMDTLQTQWSWMLQITKCIYVHLKENATYSQFFKEANETYSNLQKEHENICKKFTCDKTTPLNNLQELLNDLDKEKERILENKRQVQHLVSKSKGIVRLKPRNPEEKPTGSVVVQALCDFKQDQKVILKGNEAILKDNSQRSKWLVTGPGGLDMLVPSVCLLVPPPNKLSITLANKNEQFYEAILSVWNQFFINIKSLISWQYCLQDINRINSLTISMLAQMRPEEYRNIIKSLEMRYQEFQRASQGSQVFGDDDKKSLQGQYSGAQAYYDKLVVQLPTYRVQPTIQVEDASLTTEEVGPSKAARLDTKMGGEESRRSRGESKSTREESKSTREESKSTREESKTVRVESKTGGAETKVVSSKSTTSLTELHALRQRLDAVEMSLTQNLHVLLGEDGPRDCGLRITQLEVVCRNLGSLRDEFLRLKERIQRELEGMNDKDKAQFLRSELKVINQKLGSLEGFSSAYKQRMAAQRALLQSVLQAEDVVKVYEARLTEKETTTLDPQEIERYRADLKSMKSELDQKRGLLTTMESELSKAVHWNGQVGPSVHRCDVDLSKYAEQVGQLSDRWNRIQSQIDSRVRDLETYLQQLKPYQLTSSNLDGWISDTRQRQDTLQATKIQDINVLTELLGQQKAINSEIKGKRETVEGVQRQADTCVTSIKDYELELASYSAGLETLLNIPIKRTMLQSPSTVINQEAMSLQSRYLELFTHSGDYYKYLGDMLKNMEELKIRNTRIDLLEEELRGLRDDIRGHNDKNKSLEDALAKYQRELNMSKEQLLTMEEVKQTQAMQCNVAKDSLDSTNSQLKDLNDQVARLNYLIEEEKRKRRLAEERYACQQEEYEAVIRKRQKELEEVNWAKIDMGKMVTDKDREIERLKRQLADEVARMRELETKVSKTSAMINESQRDYGELQQERDDLRLKLKSFEQERAGTQRLEEELRRLRMSLESEQSLKLSLQEENEKIKKDSRQWKTQCEATENQLRQYDSMKDNTERDRSFLKSEIERLTLELQAVEGHYKSRLLSSEKELLDLQSVRNTLESELKRSRRQLTTVPKETQTDDSVVALDPSTLIFEGVRKTVTAQQLWDCKVLDEVTFNQLLKGQRTVPQVAVDIKVPLKGSGIIAGLTTGPRERLLITQAKRDNLLTPNCAAMLLEAQAATGYIIDPRSNEKMTVDEACSRGLVDPEDSDRVLTAEGATVGFRDPNTAQILSVGQAMKKRLIDWDTGLRLLQAQESVGGILDPMLSVFLPKDIAMDRDLINEELYRALNKKVDCYIDPDNQLETSYNALKMKCTSEASNDLLLFPAPQKQITVQGLRDKVSVIELVDANLLERSDMDKLNEGKLRSLDIEDKLQSYLRGSSCIAGVYDEATNKTLPIYQAMKDGLLRPGTTLELLEAQAASGFIIDPINNLYLTVNEAYKRQLVGPEFKDKLLSAERAVTGYKEPGSDKIISLFQAIGRGLIEKGHGLRLLEAQIASGGIIDPKHSHRIKVHEAYKRGYFDEKMNRLLELEDTKGFFDPNTEENLTYKQLKSRCLTDDQTGLILLPLKDKKKQSSQTNTVRRRRVLIVDPDTNKEMTVQEAYEKGVIDYETYLELSDQECEWEEITITANDGSTRLVITDKKTGVQYDIQDLLEKGIIEQAMIDRYRSQTMSITQFADIITKKTRGTSSSFLSSSPSWSPSQQSTSSQLKKQTITTVSSATMQSSKHLAPNTPKGVASMSIILDSSAVVEEQSPIGAIFDTEALEKVTIAEALRRGIVDSITAQRLLEAQACTGGIVYPANGRRLSIQEALRQGLIDEDMAKKLKPAQKAYIGFDDIKSNGKMSAAEAIKEKWLPHDAGQRFLEFQYVTGGLFDPALGRRRTIAETIMLGWLDERAAQKLQDTRHHTKNLTCPKTKLKISYKEAIDNSMLEENTGVRMIQASTMSSRGISSPYNASPGTGSNSGSRTGSRTGSRKGSVDLSSLSIPSSRYSNYSYSQTSYTSNSKS